MRRTAIGRPESISESLHLFFMKSSSGGLIVVIGKERVMTLLLTIVLYALGTAMLLMAAVWKLWPSWHPCPWNAMKVAGGVPLYLRHRHSPKQAPSRP
jgi:hypothetical protein